LAGTVDATLVTVEKCERKEEGGLGGGKAPAAPGRARAAVTLRQPAMADPARSRCRRLVAEGRPVWIQVRTCLIGSFSVGF
jgi:hypothetical protein